eukprot:CAMPEP_0115856800 /NCGR_PEP_ID=MMETSP0287-20121206/15243_1 /TAXON_ID=412157 /ORGANISM="Chrysochromulina rotalis, Strain UIO044" /LENGTH=377 /DNA_ID=CAMNT_0003310993 /DNA_START=14 /DNA_END=1147 /DNA_ORIENTATION=-
MAAPPVQIEDLSGAPRSSRVLAAIVTWTISAFKTRGVHIDPGFKLDRAALRRVSRAVCVVPLVNSAAALLELLSRLILLILFLALSCAPRQRTVMVERMRLTLQMYVQSVRRLSVNGEDDAGVRQRKSSLPPDATVLIVGQASVGKSTLGNAMRRLAEKAGCEEALVVAESHGLSLPPSLNALPELRLLIIVWEAAQGTPLPAYVANYMQQVERGPRSPALRRTAGSRPPEPGVRSLPSRSPEVVSAQSSRPLSATTETTAKHAEDLTHSGVPRTRSQGVSSPAPSSVAEGHNAGDVSGTGECVGSPPLRVLVVCNKTDSMPCPMPQIRGLRPDQAFIAVSALRGTNLGHLWTMVGPLLPTRRACREAAELKPQPPP